jgi:choline dehydrogenase
MCKYLVTYVDATRTRVSSEAGYFTDEVLARPNLKVVIHAQVTKILTEKVGDEIKTTGVEFAKSQNGPRFRARAKREVILA